MPPLTFAGDEAGSAARPAADMATSAARCASRRMPRLSAPVAADVGGELGLGLVGPLLEVDKLPGRVVERRPWIADQRALKLRNRTVGVVEARVRKRALA